MVTTTAHNAPKVRFYEPERNLPGRRPRVTTAETRFTIKFAKAYLEQHSIIHHGTTKKEIACARQIAINGFGIADLMAVSWASGKWDKSALGIDEFLTIIRPTVRAFEIKLNNWRKGMTQAHRYRYFANVAVLVLPIDKCEIATEYLETFKKIHVGLWGFDTRTNRIVPHYTPRPSSAIETKHQRQAIQVLASTSKALPVLQKL